MSQPIDPSKLVSSSVDGVAADLPVITYTEQVTKDMSAYWITSDARPNACPNRLIRSVQQYEAPQNDILVLFVLFAIFESNRHATWHVSISMYNAGACSERGRAQEVSYPQEHFIFTAGCIVMYMPGSTIVVLRLSCFVPRHNAVHIKRIILQMDVRHKA